MDGKYFAAGMGIIGITMIECVALYQGINGVALSSTIGVIGTIVGICFGLKIGGMNNIETTKKDQEVLFSNTKSKKP